MDDRQFGYTTQLEKENPSAPGFIDLAQLQANWNSSTKKSISCDGAREIAVEWELHFDLLGMLLDCEK